MASPVRIYFRLAFALTWGIGGVALLAERWMPESQLLAPSSPLYYVAAYSVSFVGVALTAWYGGRAGLRQLGQRLLPWRSAPHWYLVVILGYAAIGILALSAASLVGSTEFAVPGWTLVLGATFTAILKDPGPIGEEFGWRGFALPRLLERLTPLTASVTLGLVHTAWHLPLFFIPGMPQAQISFPLFTIGVVAIAIFDTALYLRTGATLLLAILVHLMANVFGGIAAEAGALSFFFVAEGIAAVLIVGAGGLRPIRR